MKRLCIVKKYIIHIGCIINIVCISPCFSMSPSPQLPDPQALDYRDDGRGLTQGIPVKAIVAPPTPKNLPPTQIPFSHPTDKQHQKQTSYFEISFVPAGKKEKFGATCLPFPQHAKNALRYSASIWSTILTPELPITIKACWAKLSSDTVLAYSGPGIFRRDFKDAPHPDTWYTSALANSIAGFDLDKDITDIHITYNQNFSWYYGNDATPESHQYDLVTVSLHEIGHGLNFSGLMSYSESNGNGSWGFNTGSPSIYDYFIIDKNGNKLINTSIYENNSEKLGKALTSNSLWFTGNNAMTAYQDRKIKIYAPQNWQPGSSYSHLDDATFDNSNHQLMTHSLYPGDAIHDPGTITKGLLKDLGWRGTSLGLSLLPPSNVKATNGNCLNRVIITWSLTQKGNSYTLYRCSTKKLDSCIVETTLFTNTYHDINISQNTNYYYRVATNNQSGQSPLSPPVSGSSSSTAFSCINSPPSLLILLK